MNRAHPSSRWAWTGATLASWIQNVIWLPGFGAFFVFLFLLFPDGRPPSPRWNWIGWLGGLATVAATVSLGAEIWPYRGLEMFGEQPEGPNDGWTLLFGIGALLVLITGVLGIASLIVRYRRSTELIRLQLRWMLFSGTVAIASVGMAFILPSVIASFVQSLTVPFVAVATTVAILRYRLYDIERIINRTLVYGSLTLMLVVGYVSFVLVFRSMLPIADDSQFVVAFSTLAMAATASPLHKRLQDTIDRRFYRHPTRSREHLDEGTVRGDETRPAAGGRHIVGARPYCPAEPAESPNRKRENRKVDSGTPLRLFTLW